MAYEDARHSGFDEAVRTNELGEVASASMSNVFWLRDGQLFTPSLVTGCLAGTTREYILEKLDVSEVRIGIDELLRADSIFISSAGIGIRQVSWLNDHMFQRSVHDVLDLLPPKTKTRMSAK
jgi:branched-subunit amino acid aminotransferase/4-amino-4-deoxychorismate lyase